MPESLFAKSRSLGGALLAPAAVPPAQGAPPTVQSLFDAHWRTVTLFDGAPMPGRAPIAVAFATALQAGDGLYVNADSKTGGNDDAQPDNVRLASALPGPDSVALLLVGLSSLGAAARRRARAGR